MTVSSPASSSPPREGRKARAATDPLVAGWREWIALPELDLPLLKAKLDTGARTSALHAWYVEPYRDRGTDMVRFGVHPRQRDREQSVECCAPIADHRRVSDSGGHQEMRYVIRTPLVIGTESWPIEVTLTNRDTMRFRFLLGRSAMQGRLVVDSARSYLIGHRPRKAKPR